MERLMPGRPAPTHDLIRLREPIVTDGGRAGAGLGRAVAETSPLGGRPPRPCPRRT